MNKNPPEAAPPRIKGFDFFVVRCLAFSICQFFDLSFIVFSDFSTNIPNPTPFDVTRSLLHIPNRRISPPTAKMLISTKIRGFGGFGPTEGRGGCLHVPRVRP